MSLGKYTIRSLTILYTLLCLCCAVSLNAFAGVDNKRAENIRPATSLENTASRSQAVGLGQVGPGSGQAKRRVKPDSDNPETVKLTEQLSLEERLATIGMDDYVITEVPRDNHCWKHVLRLQASDFFGYSKGIKELLLNYLNGLTGKQFDIFTEKQKSTLNQELLSDELPSFDLLGPFLATLINRPVIIVHLESWKKDLISDQVFHTYRPKSISAEITPAKPDDSVTKNAIWFGWIMSENHYLSLSHKKNPLTACTICLEGFHWQEKIHSTPCHHLFHSSCLLSALKEAQHCPVCRQQLPVYKSMRCPDGCSLLDFYLSKEEMEHEQARHTPCPEGRSFACLINLIEFWNTNIYTSDWPYVCNQDGCQRSFIQPAAFIAHRRAHQVTEGSPYACDEDGYQRFFLHLNALIADKRAHLNSR
ncbi:RING finger domain-containing protein [Sansalvadorimonas verongulae]|uniref:RING finger domain-containing protein n=1 Tax=Sansalvadorimonas verongulae TaxID=2172824 RepID=UPI0012BCA4AB|nr:RING finger domain-containing protein [Sansalvadorimonas verongulae]MTI11842.1 hypothetical protein [Sansalvadorimonas verongulae]